jgi:fluoride ion exporter CrcB/FEX
MGTQFPINRSGSFFIGLIVTILAERTHMNPNWRYLVPIGFIGAYTTFPTFEYETLRANDIAGLTVYRGILGIRRQPPYPQGHDPRPFPRLSRDALRHRR